MIAANRYGLQLQAILADPDDDGARLAFADLLEEEGEPERAEFIRVQCKLATMGNPFSEADDSLYDILRRRERELLGNDFCRWGVRIPRFTSFYRRGFVEAVTSTAAEFLRHADALFASQPITEVRLTTWPALERIASVPVMYRLPGRDDWRLYRYYDPDATERDLARELLSAAFPRVRTWHLPGDTIK